MSWIKYDKNPANPSEGVKKVKRELTKLAKTVEHDSDLWFFITLTGDEERDKNSLRFYEKSIYAKLARDIAKSIKDNDENGYDGFYTNRHVKMLAFIQEIQRIIHFINNSIDY